MALLWVHDTAGCKRVPKIYRFLAAVIRFFTHLTKCVGKQLKVQSGRLSSFSQGEKAIQGFLFFFSFPVSDAFDSLVLIYHAIDQKKSWNLEVPTVCGIVFHLIWSFDKFVYLLSQIFKPQAKCGCGIDERVPETSSVFTNTAEVLGLIHVLTSPFWIKVQWLTVPDHSIFLFSFAISLQEKCIAWFCGSYFH